MQPDSLHYYKNKTMNESEWEIHDKANNPIWEHFLKSKTKDSQSKSNRYRAKCVHCSIEIDGKPLKTTIFGHGAIYILRSLHKACPVPQKNDLAPNTSPSPTRKYF